MARNRKGMNKHQIVERGKCDFCGATDVPVKPEYDTEIGAGTNAHRLARICESCA